MQRGSVEPAPEHKKYSFHQKCPRCVSDVFERCRFSCYYKRIKKLSARSYRIFFFLMRGTCQTFPFDGRWRILSAMHVCTNHLCCVWNLELLCLTAHVKSCIVIVIGLTSAFAAAAAFRKGSQCVQDLKWDVYQFYVVLVSFFLLLVFLHNVEKNQFFLRESYFTWDIILCI